MKLEYSKYRTKYLGFSIIVRLFCTQECISYSKAICFSGWKYSADGVPSSKTGRIFSLPIPLTCLYLQRRRSVLAESNSLNRLRNLFSAFPFSLIGGREFLGVAFLAIYQYFVCVSAFLFLGRLIARRVIYFSQVLRLVLSFFVIRSIKFKN